MRTPNTNNTENAWNVNTNGSANNNNVTNSNGVAFAIMLLSGRPSRHFAEHRPTNHKESLTCLIWKGRRTWLRTRFSCAKESSAISRNKYFMKEFEKLFSYDNLYHSFLQCRKNQSWKDGVIWFSQNYADELYLLEQEILSGTYAAKPDMITQIHERGKTRTIHSQHIRDRIVHKIVNQEILKPIFHKQFIYANFASQNNKGTSLARKVFKCHLNRAYRKWENDFYVLQIDMKSYFESIPHWYIEKLIREKIADERIINLCLEPMKSYPNGRGLGLGSEINQTYALLCLDKLDHMIKEHYRVKEYGRSMDDMYLFSDSKSLLSEILEDIKLHIDELGLKLNEKKTNIFPIKNSISYLGYKWRLTGTGHVLYVPKKQTFIRNKRKLRKYRQKLSLGNFTYKEVENNYKTMRQTFKRSNAKSALGRMDSYYNSIFIKGGYWANE